MASLGLSRDELRSIESTRGRLQQLSSSIASLKADLYRGNPLPPAASLQASAFILQQNLSSLQEVIADNAEFFQRVAVHPSTNYPGRTHEGILIQLLRKKPEPDVETWADEGAAAALAAGVDVKRLFDDGGSNNRAGGGGRDGFGEDADDEDGGDDEEGYREERDGGGALDPLGEVWADVRDFCIERVQQFVRNESRDVYTAAERTLGVERVRTGLRRNLDEDSDEEDEDNDEDDDDEEEDEEDENEGDFGESADLEILDGPPATAAVGAVNAPAESSQAKAQLNIPKPRMEPERILWFAARGDTQLPPSVELKSQSTPSDAGSGVGRGR